MVQSGQWYSAWWTICDYSNQSISSGSVSNGQNRRRFLCHSPNDSFGLRMTLASIPGFTANFNECMQISSSIRRAVQIILGRRMCVYKYFPLSVATIKIWSEAPKSWLKLLVSHIFEDSLDLWFSCMEISSSGIRKNFKHDRINFLFNSKTFLS